MESSAVYLALQDGILGLQVLGCFELQPALVQVLTGDEELRMGKQCVQILGRTLSFVPVMEVSCM